MALGEDRAVEVAGVVVEAEHGGARAADPLVVEEVGVEGVGVERAHGGQALGDLAHALAVGVDDPQADAALEQHARDRRAHLAGAEDHDVVDALLLAPAHARPRLRRRPVRR